MTAASWMAIAIAIVVAVVAQRVIRRTAAGDASGRFFDHPAAAVGLAVLTFVVVLALFAPLIAPYRPSLQLDIVALQDSPPSWQHPLGTDLFSRDVWSRIVFGARISLGVGALATLVAVSVGAAVGGGAGYFGGATDAVLMRLVDVGLAIPRIFIVLVALAVGHRLDVVPLALLLGLTGWFGTSRLVRAEVMAMRGGAFVEGARGLGASPWRIIAAHLWPNTASTLIVSASLSVANMMLLEAGLSFLGVGVQPPAASWGNMIAESRDQLATAPWVSLFPGLAITLVVMSLHTVADGLRDALSPRETPGTI